MEGKKTFPHFYSIDKIALSPNDLQHDRYYEDTFLYYFTEHRKEAYVNMMDLLLKNPKNRIKVVGMQGSGKSHFLSDFVLRARIEKNDKFRVFYVNYNELFTKYPRRYLENELKYMVANEAEVQLIKETFISLNHEIVGMEPFLKSLLVLKKHYNSCGIKLVLVWDQINIIYRDETITKCPDAFLYFRNLITVTYYFDNIILSASNNNKDINDLVNYKKICINPFKVFTNLELLQIIRAEAKTFKPNDISQKKEEIRDYSNELGDQLWFSMSEYCFFKLAFYNKNTRKTFIESFSKANAFIAYMKHRNYWIHKSEENFRNEYVRLEIDSLEYAKVLSKVVYSDEIEKISDKVNINIFYLLRKSF